MGEREREISFKQSSDIKACLYAYLNRLVFRLFFNLSEGFDILTKDGKIFHSLGPTTHTQYPISIGLYFSLWHNQEIIR